MPSKIDEFNNLKSQIEELNGLIGTITKNPSAFDGVDITVGRFPSGTRPITLPIILSAFKKFLPQALNDAKVMLQDKLKIAASEALSEAQEVIETVRESE